MGLFLAWSMISKVDILSAFYKGVKEGLSLFQTIFPSLLAFMLMVTLLESSGIIGYLYTLFPFEVPSALVGLGLFRPISSNASLSFMIDIFKQYGPDHLYGYMASLMQGATDTTLYVVSVYLSGCKAKKCGYVLVLCLFLDFIAIMLSVVFALKK